VSIRLYMFPVGLQTVLPLSTTVVCCKLEAVNDSLDAIIRLPISGKEDLMEYLKEFQARTMTTLRIDKTYPDVGHKLILKVCKNCLGCHTPNNTQIDYFMVSVLLQ